MMSSLVHKYFPNLLFNTYLAMIILRGYINIYQLHQYRHMKFIRVD